MSTQQLLGDELLVADARVLVGDPVDDEVDAGVHVREQRRVQVNGLRERVVAIDDQDDEVRRPQEDEDDEDRQHHLRLLHRLLEGRVARLARLVARLHQTLLGGVQVHEDAHVGTSDDDEWQADAAQHEEQRVEVLVAAVEDTLQADTRTLGRRR